MAARQTERGGLDHGQGADGLGPARGGQEGHDAAVGEADQVRALFQEAGHVVGLGLEVDVVQWGVRRVAGAVGEHQRKGRRQRPLEHPLPARVQQAAVHEHEARAGTGYLHHGGGPTGSPFARRRHDSRIRRLKGSLPARGEG